MYYSKAILTAVWIVVACHKVSSLSNRTLSCDDLFLEFGVLVDLSESSGSGMYRAVCNHGYRLSGTDIFSCASPNITAQCHDIDECDEVAKIRGRGRWPTMPRLEAGRWPSVMGVDDYLFKPCDPFSYCDNTQGSYRCFCRKKWLGDGFRCRQSRYCVPLDHPRNGKVILKRRHLKARYECNPGYTLFGIIERKCRRGVWSGTEPFCAFRSDLCPDPGHIANGHRVPVNMTLFPVKTVLYFTCDDGYQLDGPSMRRCMPSRVWTSHQPRCTRMKTLSDLADSLRHNVIDKYQTFTITSNTTLGRLAIAGATGVELVFLVDESSSVDPKDFQRGLKFIKMIVGEFGVNNGPGKENKGTRVALLTFGENGRLIFNLNDTTLSSTHTFNENIDKLQPKGGGTDLHGALAKVWLKVAPLTRESAQKAIFLLSDGENNIGKRKPAIPAKNLRNDFDFEIFSIGIGQGVNKEELQSVASHPHSTHVFLLRSFTDLERLNDIVIQRSTDFRECGISGNYEARPNVTDLRAREGTWPWLVRLSALWDTCGGALICNNWILTSAKCLTDLTPEEISLEVGVHSLTEPSEHTQNVVAKHFHIHPEYDSTTHANDVALIELDTDYNNTSVIENKWVRTVCVTDKPGNLFVAQRIPMRTSRFWVGGWGFSPSSMQPPFLVPHSMELRGVDRQSCIEWSRNLNIKITSDMFCAGDRFLMYKACRGDIGGPLVYKGDDDRFVVIGVAITTQDCYKEGHYGVYHSTISKTVASWIHSITNNCNLDRHPAKSDYIS